MKLKQGLLVAMAFCLLHIGFANAEPGHEDHFQSADTNGDGKVSYDEFKAQHAKHGEEMFKKIDTNGDGVVDEAEKKAAHEKMKERRMERRGKMGKPEKTSAVPAQAQ